MNLTLTSPNEQKRCTVKILEYGDFEPEDKSVGIFGSCLGLNLESFGWCWIYNDGEVRNEEDNTIGRVEDMTEEEYEKLVTEAKEQEKKNKIKAMQKKVLDTLGELINNSNGPHELSANWIHEEHSARIEKAKRIYNQASVMFETNNVLY